MKISRKMRKFGFHTQNFGRFPGFTDVVVTFFRQNPRRFSMILFRNVSLFPRKIHNPFWGLTVFQKNSDICHWT